MIANRWQSEGYREQSSGHGRRDRSSSGRLQAASRLRRKQFDLEGGGTISQYDLGRTISLAWALWRDLAARSRQRELNGASGLVAVVWAQRREPDLTLSSLSSCSLSLSLFLSARLSLEIIWRENRSVKYLPGQSHKTHGQMKLFSGKFYFPCTTKHTVSCKTISWNGFTPKQTQPKQTKFTIFLR